MPANIWASFLISSGTGDFHGRILYETVQTVMPQPVRTSKLGRRRFLMHTMLLTNDRLLNEGLAKDLSISPKPQIGLSPQPNVQALRCMAHLKVSSVAIRARAMHTTVIIHPRWASSSPPGTETRSPYLPGEHATASACWLACILFYLQVPVLFPPVAHGTLGRHGRNCIGRFSARRSQQRAAKSRSWLKLDMMIWKPSACLKVCGNGIAYFHHFCRS